MKLINDLKWRYEDPGVELDPWMGKNPWIDFSDDTPKLLEKINKLSYQLLRQ